jgi:hypothetical protein
MYCLIGNCFDMMIKKPLTISGYWAKKLCIICQAGAAKFIIMTFSMVDVIVTLSIKNTQHIESHYVECHYTECHIFIAMLNIIVFCVFMLSVVMLNVVAPCRTPCTLCNI